MVSSRVGPEGGIALAQGLSIGACLPSSLAQSTCSCSSSHLQKELHESCVSFWGRIPPRKGFAKHALPNLAFVMHACAGRSLVSLDLSDNPLTGEVAQSLAEALRGQEKLKVLNLNDTSLGDEGVEALAEVGL